MFILFKPTVIVVVLMGCVFSLAVLLNFVQPDYPWYAWGTDEPVVNDDWAAPIERASEQRREAVGTPTRLVIPTLGVDANLESVGITSAGAMDTPKDPSDAAWFELGPRPGETGSAVIAGHYGWKNYIPAVFDNLSDLKIGDEISVEDEHGKETTFIVRELRIYDEDDMPAGVFSSYDGNVHLNLITCGGAWDSTRRSYSTRIVVFTDKK